MDYKEKIEQLKKSCYGNAPCEIDRERLEAAQIIEYLIKRIENEKKETERMKKIMRDEGIFVIPSKYPGCKSEWNLW